MGEIEDEWGRARGEGASVRLSLDEYKSLLDIAGMCAETFDRDCEEDNRAFLRAWMDEAYAEGE